MKKLLSSLVLITFMVALASSAHALPMCSDKIITGTPVQVNSLTQKCPNSCIDKKSGAIVGWDGPYYKNKLRWCNPIIDKKTWEDKDT